MRQELVDRLAPPLYAAIDFGVILVPALAVKLAADRGGMGDTTGVDLLLASTALGVVHAVIAWGRLRTEERVALRRVDMWIAAVDALVVLALGATVLLIAVFYRWADEHASIADRGYPVVAVWLGLQLVAILLSEITGRLVFRWLEPQAVAAPERRGDGVGSRWAAGADERVATLGAGEGPHQPR